MDKPSKAETAAPRRDPAPSLVDQVVALRQQGLGTDAIAAQLGISHVAVMQSLRWGF
ncbi:MAG: hypothetical protein ACPGVX_01630 [Thalassobaculaceae bacterium]